MGDHGSLGLPWINKHENYCSALHSKGTYSGTTKNGCKWAPRDIRLMMLEGCNYAEASEIRRTCGSTGEANHCQILRLGQLQQTVKKKKRKKEENMTQV